jgi:PAS domain S-box-containing protein
MQRTILIVDDDEAMKDTLCDILGDESYDLLSASTCIEALKLSREHKPHVALLDLKLPDGSGVNLLADLKSLNPDCICAMMTAYADLGSAVSALEKGAFQYLQKPVRPMELLRMVEQIFENIQYREEKRSAEEKLTESEQKYKLLAENSTDVIYKVNLETEQYSYASPSAEIILGYTNDEILSVGPRDVLTMESYAIQREKLEEAILQGKDEPEILEVGVVHKDGRVIPVEIHARLLFDNQGVPQEILGIARDITWRKEAELALKKSEERYRFLAENMGDIVWTVDMDLNTTYISPSVEKVLGYTPEEREKQKLEEMVTPESLDHINSIMVKELEHEKLSDTDPDRSITVEVEYYRRNGTIIWMENQVKAIRNQNGEIIGLYGVSRDITDRKRAEEIIREGREKLRSIVEHANELFYIHNLDLELTYVSPASLNILGYTPEEMMRKWTELASDNPINKKGIEITEKAMMTGQRQAPYLLELIKKDGTPVMLEINESPIKDSQGKVVGITGAARDVTDKIRAEQALKKAHDELNQKVKERTRELSIANENMQQEIRDRKMAEESLRKQEEKLKLQASRLEEMNTALKILLEHREDEKTELKKNVLLNMEKLVMPHLDKLASSIPNGYDNTYLNIIRTNLEGLVSPFAQELSSRRLNLTPTQMQVADFIRNGFTNKEIASHLNISVDAVSFHRKNIRKRLGLTNRKSNLRSYLQQLPDIKR